jgi:hydroxyethylthiazole kinase
MFKQILENVRAEKPLIHNITNYVTANDCANILLACGASPVMADDFDEVAEITANCGGLNINMGTLHKNTVPAMVLAGKRANDLDHPVLLDPVGAGASHLRTTTALTLMKEIRLTAIRGNLSEIRILAAGNGTSRGVDADAGDRITEENLDSMIALAKNFAQKTGAVIAITSAIDVVADSDRAFCIRNGLPLMGKVTGTGCQLSALTTAFITANQEQALEATAAAVCAMGLSGEIAFSRMTGMDGNASFRNYIIDAIGHLTPEILDRNARYEIR